MLTTLAVEGYRSLRELVLPLAPLTVVTGANGSGKSNLYRSLRLLAECAQGGAVAALAREGGLPSTLWAGPESFGRDVRSGEFPVQGTVSTKVVALRLGFASDSFGYAIDLGLPTGRPKAFAFDPAIKRECVWSGPVLRPAALLADRRNAYVRLRDASGDWVDAHAGLDSGDSMLSHVADPLGAPEIVSLRDRMRSWRFYDHVRTDAAAPARTTQIGTFTPVLAHDGADVASALQTIVEIGDAVGLEAAVDQAFPGSRLSVVEIGGRFDVHFHQHGLLRPLTSAELSDGTLRFLLWVAALLTPRPPELMVLNEPETSLHPDLLDALATLVAECSERTQVVVVTHARQFADALADKRALAVELVKELGETHVRGQDRFAGIGWTWPKR